MIGSVIGSLGRSIGGSIGNASRAARTGRNVTDAVSRRVAFRQGSRVRGGRRSGGALDVDRSTRRTARSLADENNGLVSRLDDLDNSVAGIPGVAGRLTTNSAKQSTAANKLLSEFDKRSTFGKLLSGGATSQSQLVTAGLVGAAGGALYTGINSIQETFGHQMSGASNTSLSLAKTVGTGVLGLRSVTHMRRARSIAKHVGPSGQMLNGLRNESARLHHSVRQAEDIGVQASRLGTKAGRAARDVRGARRSVLDSNPGPGPAVPRPAGSRTGGTALERNQAAAHGVRRDYVADRRFFSRRMESRANQLTSLQRRQQSTSSRSRSLASTGRQAMQKSKDARNLIRENASKIDRASAYKESLNISTNRAFLKGAGKIMGMGLGAPLGYGTMWMKDPAMQFLGKALPVGFMSGAAAGTAIGIAGMNKRYLGPQQGPKMKQSGRSFSNIGHNATLNSHRRN